MDRGGGKPIPGPKWAGRRSSNYRSSYDLSIGSDVLSDIWVGRAGGRVQTDPEPSDLGTL
jgi:hypothetical protein